jgi:hypothetical protein
VCLPCDIGCRVRFSFGNLHVFKVSPHDGELATRDALHEGRWLARFARFARKASGGICKDNEIDFEDNKYRVHR